MIVDNRLSGSGSKDYFYNDISLILFRGGEIVTCTRVFLANIRTRAKLWSETKYVCTKTGAGKLKRKCLFFDENSRRYFPRPISSTGYFPLSFFILLLTHWNTVFLCLKKPFIVILCHVRYFFWTSILYAIRLHVSVRAHRNNNFPCKFIPKTRIIHDIIFVRVCVVNIRKILLRFRDSIEAVYCSKDVPFSAGKRRWQRAANTRAHE